MTALSDLQAMPRMRPPFTPASEPFWTSGADGELRLLRDPKTGAWIHPFNGIVPEGAVAGAISGKGAVFTYTIDHHPYHPEVPPPYAIALVQLDEQADLRIVTNIVNCEVEDIHVGMRVRVVFESRGDWWPPVFEPDPDAS